jgi:hypothetical protein
MSGNERTHGPTTEPAAKTRLARKVESGASAEKADHPALRLQRSAGNAAVTEALTVQRKTFNNISGDLKGPMKTDKEGVTELNFSDGWISLPDRP